MNGLTGTFIVSSWWGSSNSKQRFHSTGFSRRSSTTRQIWQRGNYSLI